MSFEIKWLQTFSKPSLPFQTLMFCRREIVCHISESPDSLYTTTPSWTGVGKRKPLFQAHLMNLKEHNVQPHFPSQNLWIIPSFENSIILEVQRVCLCVRPASAYNPKVTIWWITLDSISLKNVTHYKYGPAACNERTASAGAALTPSAGMWHMMRTQALLRQLHIAPSVSLRFLFWVFPTMKCHPLTPTVWGKWGVHR